jgi:glycosyltransferase involved in cell wall biosynthesis
MVNAITSRLSLPVQERLRNASRWSKSRACRAFEDAEVSRLGPDPLASAEVCVIMPTYQRDERLARAVGSVLAQTVDDLAVVVVSDGPTAPVGLPDDERVVTITLSEHVGVVGVVRNVGIRTSRSPFIAFLDDDNTWQPDHLATVLPPLRGGADIAYTGVERVLDDGRRFDVLDEPFDRGRLKARNYIDVNSLAIARVDDALFNRMPRRPAESPGEDWELVWRLSHGRDVVSNPTPTVRYVIHPGSYFWQGFSEWADQELRGHDAAPPE